MVDRLSCFNAKPSGQTEEVERSPTSAFPGLFHPQGSPKQKKSPTRSPERSKFVEMQQEMLDLYKSVAEKSPRENLDRVLGKVRETDPRKELKSLISTAKEGFSSGINTAKERILVGDTEGAAKKNIELGAKNRAGELSRKDHPDEKRKKDEKSQSPKRSGRGTSVGGHSVGGQSTGGMSARDRDLESLRSSRVQHGSMQKHAVYTKVLGDKTASEIEPAAVTSTSSSAINRKKTPI